MINKRIFKIVFVVIGSFIGAGFASGKEIWTFFSRFSIYGFYGIIFSGVLTALTIYATLLIAKKKELRDYSDFAVKTNINKILSQLLNLFLLVMFYVMIAGFSSFLNQAFEFNIYISSIIFCGIVFFILSNNSEIIVKINFFIVPILIVIVVYIISKYGNGICFYSSDPSNLLLSIIYATLYASYNSILLIPMLIDFGKIVKSNKDIVCISLFSGVIIIFLTLGTYFLLGKYNAALNNVDLPVIYIINNKYDKYIYFMAISIAIITSVIVAGHRILK